MLVIVRGGRALLFGSPRKPGYHEEVHVTTTALWRSCLGGRVCKTWPQSKGLVGVSLSLMLLLMNKSWPPRRGGRRNGCKWMPRWLGIQVEDSSKVVVSYPRANGEIKALVTALEASELPMAGLGVRKRVGLCHEM
ncbi:hypothetical protein LY78DRAFT_661646 [Colletotrichum sublineola]|nr:hypothetical protein LY78DRAFT_661646 [Colletotrichum sublineola]